MASRYFFYEHATIPRTNATPNMPVNIDGKLIRGGTVHSPMPAVAAAHAKGGHHVAPMHHLPGLGGHGVCISPGLFVAANQRYAGNSSGLAVYASPAVPRASYPLL